ncbi:MAG TPA: saccharopine dehydrogenase C-terminal domain-containing protein [Solirubrobacteraceae bacterium]|nr:saccharopine dehydrogenase C-terminal domain-containing protein [Solirubrobacteraceae bacterium]
MSRIAVVGLGNVGRLIAEMLTERGFEVQGVDADPSRVTDGHGSVIDVTDSRALEELFGGVDAAVSCLPYYLNAAVATAAHAVRIHYFDLTEDVGTSRIIHELAESSGAIFMPRCGLAPGFVCVLGGGLAARLDSVERIELRAGALPRSPNNAAGYACNWSPAGVVNEYLNDCEQLRGGELVSVPPLADLETIVIDGARYEAFTTSGGLGTMCETFAGRVDRLDYKTIRYEGHCDLMRFMLLELGLGREREEAVRLLTEAYPPVREDLVIVYVAAAGTSGGRRAREEFVRVYRPRIVAGTSRTAIAWTTAAGAVSMVELLADGSLPAAGFVRQEQVPLDAFLGTSAGQMLAGGPSSEARDEVSLVPAS